MTGPKTRPSTASVESFLIQVDGEEKRSDSRALVRLMSTAAGASPVMWGADIVGFGSQTYRYTSGKELDWPLLAFSPRKQALTLYLMPGLQETHPELLARLGPHKISKACLYIRRLRDVDMQVLEELIRRSVPAAQP